MTSKKNENQMSSFLKWFQFKFDNLSATTNQSSLNKNLSQTSDKELQSGIYPEWNSSSKFVANENKMKSNLQNNQSLTSLKFSTVNVNNSSKFSKNEWSETSEKSPSGAGLEVRKTSKSSLQSRVKSENFKGKDSVSGKTWFRSSDTSKQQVVSITYEEIGLFPRSFNRVFDRFFKQLFFDVENLVIQEYRFYRYLFLTTVKCLFILFFVPFLVNFICKNYLVRPITEYYWNSKQPEIFLNSYQQKRAFSEFQHFEEKIYFESLIVNAPNVTSLSPKNSFENQENSLSKESNLNEKKFQANIMKLDIQKKLYVEPEFSKEISFSKAEPWNVEPYSPFPPKGGIKVGKAKSLETNDKEFNLREPSTDSTTVPFFTDRQKFDETVQKLLQKKTLELANHYNEESIEAITNFFADLISLSTLFLLLLNLEIQINITKSFLLEVFFGLDDSKKSLLILFVTDLLVGYHSPNIWELFFSSLFDHYGLPESQTTIFLLVATLPVLLDVLFKYLIFRHLNRASPATVATYHAMIE